MFTAEVIHVLWFFKVLELFNLRTTSTEWRRRAWQPTPVFLPRKSHGQRGMVGPMFMGSQRVGHNWSTQDIFPSISREDPLEKGKATHSSILAWRIPLTSSQGNADSGLTLHVFGYWLSYYLLAVWPSDKLNFLFLIFFCKMGVAVVPTSLAVMRTEFICMFLYIVVV